jgi:hypothetical protein
MHVLAKPLARGGEFAARDASQTSGTAAVSERHSWAVIRLLTVYVGNYPRILAPRWTSCGTPATGPRNSRPRSRSMPSSQAAGTSRTSRRCSSSA